MVHCHSSHICGTWKSRGRGGEILKSPYGGKPQRGGGIFYGGI